MRLTFRKREVKNLTQLQELVTEHADAIEPGCRIVAAGVNLGRSTVDLAGLDARQTPVLVALGFTADDEMLFRMLEAYAWCLEYPESVRRIVGEGHETWPPRVVFVAERLLEAFLRKVRLLKFPAVDCFEFRFVEVNGSTGFYLDPVDWGRSRTLEASDTPAPARQALHCETPRPVPEPPAPALTPERPAVAASPERDDLPGTPAERPEPVAGPANGVNGTVDHAGLPHWLELMPAPPTPAAPEPIVEPAAPELETPSLAAAEEPKPVKLPEDISARPRDSLEGLDLPPSRELAPTWRKFLERLTSGFETLAAPPVPETAPSPGPARDPEPTVPAPPMPATPRKNGAGPEQASDEPRTLPGGVQLPANSDLAHQWRRFLDKPTIEDSKISIMKDYLHREFPLCTIYDYYEFQRSGHVFQLQDNHGKVVQLATITAEFFEGRRDSELRPWCEKHKLSQAMRQAGQVGVLVTPAGLTIEKR